MKKFLVLYMAPLASFEKAMKSSPEDSKKWMKEWQEWSETNKKAIKDPGSPVGKAKKISAKGVEDLRNNVGGYSVVEAQSLDDATHLFGQHPHYNLPEAWVELIEVVDMPGM